MDKMRRRLARRASFLACVMLWSALSSCGGKNKQQATASAAHGQTKVDQVLVQLKDAPPGLAVRLSEGKPGAAGRGERLKVPPAVKLDEAAAERLLKRLAPLVADKGDKADFALREKSQPPPQTGNIIKGTFPPPQVGKKPPAVNVAGSDLKVLRFAPEGEVP